MKSIALAWLVVFSMLLLACTSFPSSEPAPTGSRAAVHAASTMLLPADTLEEDLILIQRVSVRWEGGEESFDAVVQKQGDSLLLLGLGPMNAVGFTLSLEGEALKFENRSGRELPFEPVRILADVQRAFYPWIEPRPACSKCEHRTTRDGIVIVERFKEKGLDQRAFAIEGQPEIGEVVIQYAGWFDGFPIARHVVLVNNWFGYELIIETRSVEAVKAIEAR